MAELIVVGFKGNMLRASQVLDELRLLDDEWLVDLRDAVAVHREYGGELKMDKSYQPTSQQGAGWGGAMGLLIGATLAIPFTAGASAAVAAGALAAGAIGGAALGVTTAGLDAAFWKDTIGIPEDFVHDVSGLIEPGASAIYAILESAQPEIVAARFQGYGGTVLHTSLTSSQQDKLAKALHTAAR